MNLTISPPSACLSNETALSSTAQRSFLAEAGEGAEMAEAATGKSWSVVIVGRWNRGIYTPAGIARRLFGLPEEHQLEIGVALNMVAPFRVKHEGLIVVVDDDRLMIETENRDYELLSRAMGLGARALDDLPHTPVVAAGINIILSPVEETLAGSLQHAWDEVLRRAQHQILFASVERTIAWNDGRLMMKLLQEDATAELMVNFERRSRSTDELKGWLRRPIDEISRTVGAMVALLSERR